MFSDPLQERLENMERRNPSPNKHHQNIWQYMRDRAYFFNRFFNGSVESLPIYFRRLDYPVDADDATLRSIKDRNIETLQSKYRNLFETSGYNEWTTAWLLEALRDANEGEILERVDGDLEKARKLAKRAGMKVLGSDTEKIYKVHDFVLHRDGLELIFQWVDKATHYVERAIEKGGDTELYSLARKYLEQAEGKLVDAEEAQRKHDELLERIRKPPVKAYN